MECSCEKCNGACEYKPGWFAPGEAEKAAALKGLSLEAFFKQYLGVDWWEGDGNTFVLAPATTSMSPGEEYPANPKGTCVFFQDGHCSIHAAKPQECRDYDHTRSHADGQVTKKSIVARWKQQQEQIAQLLGREPTASEYGAFESWMWS